MGIKWHVLFAIQVIINIEHKEVYFHGIRNGLSQGK